MAGSDRKFDVGRMLKESKAANFAVEKDGAPCLQRLLAQQVLQDTGAEAVAALLLPSDEQKADAETDGSVVVLAGALGSPMNKVRILIALESMQKSLSDALERDIQTMPLVVQGPFRLAISKMGARLKQDKESVMFRGELDEANGAQEQADAPVSVMVQNADGSVESLDCESPADALGRILRIGQEGSAAYIPKNPKAVGEA